MAHTLISRSARRVGIACTAPNSSYFTPDAGYQGLTVNAGHEARIRPPKGIWTVVAEGEVAAVTPSISEAGKTNADNGMVRFTRAYNGAESMLIHPVKTGAKCTVVLEEAPPLRNCKILGWWSRWR